MINPRIEGVLKAYRARGVKDPETGGYYLTTEQVAESLGISRSQATRYIQLAEKKGYLRREKKKVQYEYVAFIIDGGVDGTK